ncbi:MAG TPA: hypothetical protein VFW35_02280 [Sphingomicrobium sp.]|nr:hypothetical protein [Sphingomicrobium sp.]
MSSYPLIEAFKNRTTLPINLDEAAQWLLDKGIQNEINFIGVELEPQGAIRGFVKRYKTHSGVYTEPNLVSNIYYETRQPSDWQHLTCAKELLHVLDGATVTSKEQFEKLADRLALPDDLRHLLEDPDFALVDKMGTAPASALLLPMAAREVLMPVYPGVMNAADIAKLAVMPVEHVRTVMSDSWPVIHRLLEMNQFDK